MGIRMTTHDRSRFWDQVVLAAWVLVVVAGFALLGFHASRPGDPGEPARRWPLKSPIRLDASQPTLLIFLHPRCPCTVASLAELERLIVPFWDRVPCRAIVYRPTASARDWGKTAVADQLAAIPGVKVFQDAGGLEARRFGVATSGHALLYAPDGRLLFTGGITPARGHQGDSVGRATLAALIAGIDPRGQQCSPVFGCPIVGEASGSGRDSIP